MLNYCLKTLLLIFSLSIFSASAQESEYVYFDTLDISIHALNSKYKPSRKRVIDIEHMRLEITPFFEKKSMYGKAFINISAYNKPIQSVELDAKGMDISQVYLIHSGGFIPVEFDYDNLLLTIQLPRAYEKDEQFTVFVEYVAQPYKLGEKGIELKAGRGMYFIDPFDKNGVKPAQMWTQGETDANSVWFPTVDSPNEQFTIFIEYVAQPYKLGEKGIELKAGRGMYFIDPYDKNGVKPVQMWTQGETDANSVWFPTVDSPNEQFTQEIYITVDERYTTLSNGLLKSSEVNPDGTRTDYWQQDKPHAPHLVMVAAGMFEVSYDDWGPLKLSYYTVPEFSSSVRKVFGKTPNMMSYYSKQFGVDFPWEKYAQMVVYDYTSGAMENTTAVIYYDGYYADEYDLLDRNYDETIAHELAHQWFGDLVSCESWAHLALNESFATYSEYLWYDHEYSREAADRLQQEYLFSYLNEFVYKSEPIVNYYYDDADDMFDSHRYEKGGCVLHMLRDYMGDEDFFAGITHYLKMHQYGSAEMDNFRLSLEKISGEDLNWFFEQWFMNEGHPVVEIRQSYNSDKQEVKVSVVQKQPVDKYITFQFPLSIDIYVDGKTERQQVWVDERKETYTFSSASKPDLVNVDAKKTMLWEKTTDLTKDELIFQYNNAPLYVDRLEAIDGLRWIQTDKEARKVMTDAINDKFWSIRKFTLQNLEMKRYNGSEAINASIGKLALEDPVAQVRRSALEALARLNDELVYSVADSLFQNDSSRMVKAVALSILYADNKTAAYKKAAEHTDANNYYLKNQVAGILAEMGGKDQHEFFKRLLWGSRPYYVHTKMDHYMEFLKRMDPATIEDATTFLLDMALYEESETIQNAARNALLDLHDHFSKAGGFATDDLKKRIDSLK